MSYTELTVWTRGIIMDSACGSREHSESAPAARVGVGPHANEITSGAARASGSLEPKALGVGPQRREEGRTPRALNNEGAS